LPQPCLGQEPPQSVQGGGPVNFGASHQFDPRVEVLDQSGVAEAARAIEIGGEQVRRKALDDEDLEPLWRRIVGGSK